MNKKLRTAILKAILIIIVLIVGAISVAYIIGWQNSSDANQSSPIQQSEGATATPEAGKEITVTGTIICLQPKDGEGPHTLECALGVKQDDGVSYALQHQDPSLIGSIPTGQAVKITGKFTTQDSKYAIAGLINVTSVERL